MPIVQCCDGVVLSEGYHFCPRCGRCSGRLATIPDLYPELAAGQTEFSLTLRNSGPGPLLYRISDLSLGFELGGEGSGEGEIPGEGERQVAIRLRPGTPERLHGSVTVWSGDAPRLHWWQAYNEDRKSVV